MNLPYLDLLSVNARHHLAIRDAFDRVMSRGRFCQGEEVASFEAEFSAATGAAFTIGVGSGTEALWLSLLALGIGPGDEVITAPNSFVATAEAILRTGATPVFADVDPLTRTLDPSCVADAITPHTRAIVPVHLHGLMADMPALRRLASRHALAIVEDACQAHGAALDGASAGTLGDAACFSFYPGKNLGACGDAGAITTSDAALAEKLRALRDHGRDADHCHRVLGWNARMDEIQAAILRAKLPHLDAENHRRAELASLYDGLLAPVSHLRTPHVPPGHRHAFHAYAVETTRRERLCIALERSGIGYRIHYPTPLHLLPALRALHGRRGDCPVAETLARRTLSLPLHPAMAESHLHHIADAVLQVCGTPLAA